MLGNFGALPFGHFGLGQTEEEVAKAKLAAMFGDLEAAEDARNEWANSLFKLIETRTASCLDIETYNRAAVEVFLAEYSTFLTLLLAGMRTENIEAPPYPTLYAEHVEFSVGEGGSISIMWRLPSCAGTTQYTYAPIEPGAKPERIVTSVPAEMAQYPDYATLRMWGAGTAVSVPEQLGAAPAVIWASVALVATIGAVIAGVIVSFAYLWKIIFHYEIEQGIEAKKIELQDNNRRLSALEKCMDNAKPTGGWSSVAAARDTHNNCVRGIEGLAPRTRGISSGWSIFGVAAVAALTGAGVWWYTKRRA